MEKTAVMKMIKKITINNFKSLENVTIRGCKTFNLFIGRPNVGKSNIIEALSFMAVPYLFSMKKSLGTIFRIERGSALFYNGNISNAIDIDLGDYGMRITNPSSNKVEIKAWHHKGTNSLDIVDLKVKKGVEEYPIFKPYSYRAHAEAEKGPRVDMPFLCPWDGNNLMQVLQQNESIKQYFVELLKAYGLQLTFDLAQQEVRILKPLDDSSSFIVPYMALADSIKRLMFYKAAVDSNRDSVLLFEELEAHAYPPYISKIVQTIINNKNNQYFITTHSPYVLNEFLEDQSLDVAIHIVDFKNGKTIVKTLSAQEEREVYNYGIDLFFNTEAFVD